MINSRVLAAIWLLTTGVCQGQSLCWWGMGKQHPLVIDTSLVLIQFDPGISFKDATNELRRTGRFLEAEFSPVGIDDSFACSLATKTGYTTLIDSLRSVKSVMLIEPAYLTSDGHSMVAGGSFCIRFRAGVPSMTIDSINARFGVVIDHAIDVTTNEYLFRRTAPSDYTTLQLANLYHELALVDYCHPNFRADIVRCSYKLFDYYNSFQPHMKRVIGKFNDTTVWDFAGLNRTVKVAVVDDGITAHEDLPAGRILPGFNAADWNSDASPADHDAHGMACAGLIAASHTGDSIAGGSPNTGVISLNPNAAIIPINIFGNHIDSYCSDEELAAGIDSARVKGAAVLSNSWGYQTWHPDVDVVHQAIYRARYDGRGGKGCPVIFAAGNDDINWLPFPARDPLVFPVGAIKLNDSIWDWSDYDTLPYNSISVVAPSDQSNGNPAIWSIDQMDTSGANRQVWEAELAALRDVPADSLYECACPRDSDDLDYLCNFNGTSAACPLVSGVASLLIARDSMLTAETIEEILTRSAVTDLDWGTLETVPDTLYGYGRVDAFRAMLSITRGDVNNSGGVIDLSDLTALVSYLTAGGFVPYPSVLLGDCNCTGDVDLQDMSYLIGWLIGTGDPPVKPCFEFGPQ